MKTLTNNLYSILDLALDHFNFALYGGTLPECLITLQRSRRTAGYFSPNRWIDKKEVKKHEIALNPSGFASSNLIELLQTIVHEQCHFWQHLYGAPSRSGYHNKQWADKMESIGLMPSSTGKPGGRKTGQNMSDYPIFDGLFSKACISLVAGGFALPYFDRFSGRLSAYSENMNALTSNNNTELVALLLSPMASLIEGLEANIKPGIPIKSKYHCNACGANVWGKPGLDLACRPCDSVMNAV